VSHPLRRGLRRLRRWLALSAALLLILGAVVVALAHQLLPVLERHPGEVAAWLSSRIGQPVSISGLSARWSRRGPLLDLRDLRIGGGPEGGGLDIGSARVRVNVYSGWFPGQPLLALRVEGLRLELARSLEGRWQARGFYGGAGVDIEQALAQLERVGEVELFNGALVIEDRYADFDVRLDRIDARLRTIGGAFRFALRVHAEDSPPLRLTGELDTALRHGQLHLGAQSLDLPSWLQGSRLAGLGLARGRADLDLWLDVEDGRIAAIDSMAALDQVQITRAAATPDSADASASTLPPAELDALRLQFGLRREEDGWRLQVPRLEIQSEAARSLSGLDLRWQDGRLALRLDAVEFAAFAELLPALAPVQQSAVEWLHAAQPRGRLEDLQLTLDGQGGYGIRARLVDLGLAAVDARPGFSGLSGSLDGGSGGLFVELDAPDFVLDAPQSLIAPVTASLSGQVALWQDTDGPQVELAPLRIVGADFGATIEGRLWMDAQGRRPSIDARAVVDPGSITAAHRFWVRNRMPPKTVEWLERALVEGELVSGVALIRGDLDDWPFSEQQGVFDARAEVRDVVMDYLPGWPTGTQVAGTARFLNNSLDGEVSARVLGVPVQRAAGGIADFRAPVLRLDLEGEASGTRLLALLRETPLWERFGQHLRGLSVGGRGAARVRLEAPLKRELGELQLEGQVDLADADLVDSQWGLRFGGASGRLRFSREGFSADALGVRFDGQPASLSLAAGRFCAEPGHVFEASLQGSFAAESLLALRPELHWLEPYLQGQSAWSLDLHVPEPGTGPVLAAMDPETASAAADTAPPEVAVAKESVSADAPASAATLAAARTQLRVRSDLVGTTLRLPAPLRKAEDERLPLDLRIDLPTRDGRIDLRLGRLLRLVGRLGEDAAAFRGVAAFGGEAIGALPSRGLQVRGATSILDAAAWVGLALGGGGQGLRVEDIDISAGQLRLGERVLPDQRVQMQLDAAGGRRLIFEGPAAQGRIDWPLDASAPVVGRFDRLHWPPGPDEDPSAPPRRVDEPDPTALPPIDLVVEDAAFGKARLGRLELLTRRSPDGQWVEKLQTRSEDLAVDIRGDWSRSLQGSESRFTIGFSGEDLGRMLGALGISPLVQGGQTRADMDLRWQGGPANFSFAGADGQLRLKVGKGRVPELEPGAGRLIGLLSLAEIPRRLALDFSDFFRSGLAFNSIEGSFQLAGGNAVTEDLRIDGPAAEIKLRGRTGLAARDYDLQVEVLPRTGSVLPALGAITAGPAGAAVGAVAQAVLNAPMKQMNRTLYSVSGSWDEPKIEVIDRGPEREPRVP
jgi:uncharacterized protein YhdP